MLSQKQTLRQGFMSKSLINQVIPREMTEGVEKERAEKGKKLSNGAMSGQV
jgi:hypothetical protein